MNPDTIYTSMLDDMRDIRMTERRRAQAEEGVRLSAAIIETLLSMAGRTARSEQPRQPA